MSLVLLPNMKNNNLSKKGSLNETSKFVLKSFINNLDKRRNKAKNISFN